MPATRRSTRPSVLRRTRVRIGLTAGLLALVLFGAGAAAVVVIVRHDRLAATRDLATQQAGALLAVIGSGGVLGGDYGPLPYELATGTTVISSSSELKPLELAGAAVPALSTDESVLGIVREIRLPTGAARLSGVRLDVVTSNLSVDQINAPSSITERFAPTAVVRASVVVDPEPARTAALEVGRIAAVAVPLVAVIIGCGVAVSVGRALRPVEQIRLRALEISTGDLSMRVPVPSSGDEIQELAATVNHTLARLQSQSLAQRRFVSDAAHELRTPLATLRTTVEVALHYAAADSDLTTLRAIEQQSAQLVALTEDLLELARLDAVESAAVAPPGGVTSDLAAGVAAALETAPPPSRLRVGRLDVGTPVAGPTVTVAPRDLTRIVVNLLTNAYRHADAEVRIGIESAPAGTVVRLLVANDGPPIAAADHEQIFAPFHRLEPDRGPDSGGTGLGLAIARALAENAGGRLEVRPSAGACFVLTLPVATAGAAQT